jgi:hypothetical protein
VSGLLDCDLEAGAEGCQGREDAVVAVPPEIGPVAAVAESFAGRFEEVEPP